jgi:Protein of unknown function (DUF995)
MPGIKFYLVAVLALTLVVSACRSGPPKIVNEPGVTRLNTEQARAHVSGNTEKWREGTVYYSPGGKLEMVWRKAKTNGVWNVLADGNVCFEVKKWKNQACHYYVNNNGAITLIEGVRNRGVVEIVEGKKLPAR